MTRSGSRKGSEQTSGPQLDPKIVANDEMLGAVLGDVADADADYRRASRKIVRLQDQLRELVEEDAWRTYLALEVAVNDRTADFDEAVVRWAFAEGRRHPLPEGEGST